MLKNIDVGADSISAQSTNMDNSKRAEMDSAPTVILDVIYEI
ncbi:hypothetical protein MNBD_GAMMA01-1504 [hydrothermal vent metagenome]|uniref:Uncharacterized protein n=1 Tax=hydrothermal vent metagenome TaxID=652676 RepID=A0A3B0VM38_9ZZZZ